MMEKYFNEATQEMMYKWVVNAVYSDAEASSAVYKVMATRSQIRRILNSFGDNVKRLGVEIYEENEASTFDGSVYEYTIFYCNGESWIEVTAYQEDKMTVFYAKDFVSDEDGEKDADNKASETSASSEEAFDPDEKFQVKEPHILI